jgi:hypothetical protein
MPGPAASILSQPIDLSMLTPDNGEAIPFAAGQNASDNLALKSAGAMILLFCLDVDRSDLIRLC